MADEEGGNISADSAAGGEQEISAASPPPPRPPPRRKLLGRRRRQDGLICPLGSFDRSWLEERAIKALGKMNGDSGQCSSDSSPDVGAAGADAGGSETNKAQRENSNLESSKMTEQRSEASTSAVDGSSGSSAKQEVKKEAAAAGEKETETDDELNNLVGELASLRLSGDGQRSSSVEEEGLKKGRTAKKRRSITRQNASDAGDGDDELEFKSSSSSSSAPSGWKAGQI